MGARPPAGRRALLGRGAEQKTPRTHRPGGAAKVPALALGTIKPWSTCPISKPGPKVHYFEGKLIKIAVYLEKQRKGGDAQLQTIAPSLCSSPNLRRAPLTHWGSPSQTRPGSWQPLSTPRPKEQHDLATCRDRKRHCQLFQEVEEYTQIRSFPPETAPACPHAYLSTRIP